MRIFCCGGSKTHSGTLVSYTTSIQLQRRFLLCVHGIGQLRTVDTLFASLFKRVYIPVTARRSVDECPPCPVPLRMPCAQPKLSLLLCSSLHHYFRTCEARVRVACPLKQPFQEFQGIFGRTVTGCQDKGGTFSDYREGEIVAAPHPMYKRVESELLWSKAAGGPSQKHPSFFFRMRGARGIAGTANAKDAPAWKQRLEDNVEGRRDRPIYLNDESGTRKLLMSPAAIQRLETLCARRRLQESIAKRTSSDGLPTREEGPAEEPSQRTAPQPVVGLQVRVTSGGCSGYQYSFVLLTSEELQRLHGNKEYSIFWPPGTLSNRLISAFAGTKSTGATRVVSRATSASNTETVKFSRAPAASTCTPSSASEKEGSCVERQEDEKVETSQKTGEAGHLCGPGSWCVLVDRCSLPLFGSKSVIDFEDTLAAAEFVVQQNDQAENVCSCGRSFALKDDF